LWPRRLREQRKKHHEKLRSAWLNLHAPDGLEGDLLMSQSRYPVDGGQVAPTALGNAIRRFETYGADLYHLDSQRLFHHLAAQAPLYVRDAQDRARTNVDFAVCLVYDSVFLAVASAVTFAATIDFKALVALSLGVVIAPLSYRLAVLATDEWAATTRAMVDLGRIGVAQAFGLQIPTDVTEERRMWRYVNSFTRGPNAPTGATLAWLTHFRRPEPGGGHEPPRQEDVSDGSR
jgi:hypothetical protein